MRRIAAIARKELRQLRRDPLSLIMLLGLPAFYLYLGAIYFAMIAVLIWAAVRRV